MENLIAGLLTASIDSIYCNLKVPARPINAKRILPLLLRTVKLAPIKLFIALKRHLLKSHTLMLEISRNQYEKSEISEISKISLHLVEVMKSVEITSKIN